MLLFHLIIVISFDHIDPFETIDFPSFSKFNKLSCLIFGKSLYIFLQRHPKKKDLNH